MGGGVRSSSTASLLRAAWLNGIAGIPSPLILLLEPSERCNARCPFCYHWREAGPGELELDEILRVLEEAWELGCRFLYLSGGEPTLHPDRLEILAAARRFGYEISMTTNGSRLTEELPRLAPLLDALTVSIDRLGIEQDRLRGIPGLFASAVDGLLLASKLGLSSRINMNLYEANLGEVRGMAELARSVGAGLHVRLLTRESSALDIPAFELPRAMEAASMLLDLRRELPGALLTPEPYLRLLSRGKPFRCRPLSLLLPVDAQGRVYLACPRHEGTKDRVAGNVREASLSDIWTSAAAWRFREEAASCRPGVDCYSSCILDVSLLAGLSGASIAAQLLERGLLGFFRGER